MRRLMRLTTEDAGQVIVIVAGIVMFFVALIVVVGDNALVRMQQRNLQNAADAAAMACIQDLPADRDEAEAKALQYAVDNIGRWDDIDVFIREDNAFIRVTVKKHSGALFGGLLTLGDPVITAKAAAEIQTSYQGFGMILLDSSACPGLYIDSNAEINVVGGGVYVNSSNCNKAIEAKSNSEVSADFISIMDSSSVSGGCSHYDPCPVTSHSSPIADPFADVPVPPYPTSNPGGENAKRDPASGYPGWTGSSSSGSCTSPGNEVKFSSGSWTLYPGFYNCKLFFDGGQAVFQPGTYTFAGGFEINSDARVTWARGIYVTMREGFELNSNSRLTGNQILLYNTCHNPCGTSGKIYLDSNAQFNATPYGEPYANIVIWQDRNSTRMLELNSNTGTGILGGAIYAPKAKVYSDSNMTTPLQIVAGSAEFNSNATLDLTVTPDLAHIETTRWAMVE